MHVLVACDSAGNPERVGGDCRVWTDSQGCLLARRLVQSGVRFVEVNSGGWDMHTYLDEGMQRVGGGMDIAYAALLADLERTGLLASTLVVVGTEFGRTPRISDSGGRDHYPKVFSTVFAGGGVKAGFVLGASDKSGHEVADKQVTVQDYIATIGAAMGAAGESGGDVSLRPAVHRG